MKELTDALATNDADSLRSAVSADPTIAGRRDAELEHAGSDVRGDPGDDAGRTAIGDRDHHHRPQASGVPLVFNLVVHVTDNQIVNFR